MIIEVIPDANGGEDSLLIFYIDARCFDDFYSD